MTLLPDPAPDRPALAAPRRWSPLVIAACVPGAAPVGLGRRHPVADAASAPRPGEARADPFSLDRLALHADLPGDAHHPARGLPVPREPRRPGAIAWAIVVLTLIVRAILIPLYRKQLVSQRRMQLIQPELKEIQKRFKGDRMKARVAQQELFKERGINPLAGCLPLLLQLPLLFIMYSVIQNGLTNQDPTRDARRSSASRSSTSSAQNLVDGGIDAARARASTRTCRSSATSRQPQTFLLPSPASG